VKLLTSKVGFENVLPMRLALIFASLLLGTFRLCASEPKYVPDVTRWQAVDVPSALDRGARMVWSFAANYSNLNWRVFTKDGEVRARLSSEAPDIGRQQLSFAPEAGKFSRASATAAVDDGWLVGFNQGEFGGALYWFSRDGKRSYPISDDQIVDFFSRADGIYAIEGLAHLGGSRGSVLRISRPKERAPWHAQSVAALPSAPYAVAVLRDGTAVITLSYSLVSVGTDLKVKILYPDAPWGELYPSSSVLAADEQKLFIGMRQFVGEFDFKTNTLRCLIPSDQFLNRLSKEEEARIRQQFGS
jgi:hypothetical protein